MKCPWRTTTIEEVTHTNGSKTIKQEFGECYGDKCPFLRYTTNGFDSVGFPNTKAYCARAIVDEKR